MQISTVGLDLAKHWFQVHGVDAMDTSSFAGGCAQRCDRLLPIARAVSSRHGSLCDSASLGARADSAGA
jgi:hypothetical protein